MYEFEKSDMGVRVAVFDAISDDNWAELLQTGIPLYQELNAQRDEGASGVGGRLKYLRMTLENSGAGSKEQRMDMIEKLKNA